jgi:hypothetical protein
MQLQGELQSKGHQPHYYKGPIHGVSVIVRNEGVKGIYRGIGCAYVYQILLNGCRLGFYEPMRNALTGLIFKDPKKQSLGINMFCGASSGILGAMAGSPFFLVKTRLQSYSPFLPVGTQHKYKNAVDGAKQIFKAEGISGLYRGVTAAMVRTGFGSSVQLPTYFFAKRRLVKHLGMEEGAPLHLASSTISGFVVCIFMHPPGKPTPHQLLPTYTNLSTNCEDRHCHVSSIQPKWQPLQGRLRLPIQDDPHRGILRHLQGLRSSSRTNLTAYHLDSQSGGTDEQVDEENRRSHPDKTGDEGCLIF